MCSNNNLFEAANKFIDNVMSDGDDTKLVISQFLSFDEGILFWYQSEEYVLCNSESAELIGDTRFVVLRSSTEILKSKTPLMSNDDIKRAIKRNDFKKFIKFSQ